MSCAVTRLDLGMPLSSLQRLNYQMLGSSLSDLPRVDKDAYVKAYVNSQRGFERYYSTEDMPTPQTTKDEHTTSPRQYGFETPRIQPRNITNASMAVSIPAGPSKESAHKASRTTSEKVGLSKSHNKEKSKEKGGKGELAKENKNVSDEHEARQ